MEASLEPSKVKGFHASRGHLQPDREDNLKGPKDIVILVHPELSGEAD